ncbi:MAG: acetyltransferase [Bacteroidetes bacterium]|nr:acetyltransferase [Bacteroidota bacterium]
MKDIIIIGTGGAAAEMTSYIEHQNAQNTDNEQINLLGYIDYPSNIEKYWVTYKLKAPVLSDIDTYQPSGNEEVLVCISDIPFRNKMIDILINKNARFADFFHPSVIIAGSVSLGVGNIIYPFCIIGPNTVIGDFNMITSYSFISHDCRIGNRNFFSTAGLSGHVNIGNNNFLGIRSTVIPYINIGDNNLIQAGMVVDKNVSDNSTMFYRYKEQVLAIPKT